MIQVKDNNTSPKLPIGTEISAAISEDVKFVARTYKSIPKPTEENWEDVLLSLKVKFNHTYEEPPTCIEIIDNDINCRFGTLGNFSAVIGKAKSGKTYFLNFILSSAIRGENWDRVKVDLPTNQKRVILFDTEQSLYDVSRVVYRITTLAKVDAPANFEPYCLRSLSTEDRLMLIEKTIYSRNDLGIVVIDGIRDLIQDINSAADATMITSKLLKWTEERNIHIIVVLHQNKGDNNARGHIGTEIINKAETVVSVEKEGDLRVVKAEYTRGRVFNSFAFEIDLAGMPYIDDTWIAKSGKDGKKKITAQDIPEEIHKKYIQLALSLQPDPTYAPFVINLKLALQKDGVVLGDNKVREYVQYYLNNKWLKKVPFGKYKVYKMG